MVALTSLICVSLTVLLSIIGPTSQTCPCENNGTCFIGDCYCTEEWTGPRCSEPKCEQCYNGDCVAYNTCECDENWTGANCSTPVCTSLCQNGGICTQQFTCGCLDGWEGKRCSRPICDEDFCKNGGSCFHPNVNCTCQHGWKGDTCDTKVVDVKVLAPSLLLGLTVLVMIILMVAIMIGKLRKKRPTLLESIETQDNTAYNAVKSKKNKKYKTKIPFRPLSDTDAIYDEPSSHKFEDSEVQSIYENTFSSPYEYNYI